MLFDSFEAYDVQETRRVSRAEGRAEGELRNKVQLVCKKLEKGMAVSEIADILEEEETFIQRICDTAEAFAPEYDVDKIVEKLMKK